LRDLPFIGEVYKFPLEKSSRNFQREGWVKGNVFKFRRCFPIREKKRRDKAAKKLYRSICTSRGRPCEAGGRAEERKPYG